MSAKFRGFDAMGLQHFVAVVASTIALGCVAADARGGEIKAALFFTFDGKECFLSDVELEKLAGVLGRMKPAEDHVQGKFLPQGYVFYYWEYSQSDKSLKRRSIDFNSEGHSINWKMNESDARIILSLAQDLVKRASKPLRVGEAERGPGRDTPGTWPNGDVP